ncbi:MAG: TlpA family protein disulfide reductase [Acidobacteriota bacterium]|nr:TlpA family protein disulfide reductase [Acidobacteriota bacterium]
MMRMLLAAILVAGAVHSNGADAHSALRKSPELAIALPGQGEKLLSQYRGKVVALEFILTPCPHCQAASKIMNKMQERYGNRGLQVLDVAIDQNADLRVENFAKEYQAGFPVGWTTIDHMMNYMGFTERPVVPQLVLIDRTGNIHYQTPREGDADSLKEDIIAKRIEELLEMDSSSKTRHSARATRMAGVQKETR